MITFSTFLRRIQEQIGIEYKTPYNQSIEKSAGMAKRIQRTHAHSEMQKTETQERKAHLKRLNQLTDR